MSTQYQSGKDVPTEVLAARLNELAHVVAQNRDRIGDEFTMRIPAECDRDADLVMSEAARRLSAAPDVQGEPVEIDYPDFHWQGMGCGLEDRNITDRYEAMRYGWEAALDRVAEDIDSLGPLYAAPQPAPDVSALVEALERIARMDSMSYHSLESAKIVARAALAAYRKQGGE